MQGLDWQECNVINNLKLHGAKAVKNMCIQGKLILGLTFNPELAITSEQSGHDYTKLT